MLDLQFDFEENFITNTDQYKAFKFICGLGMIVSGF